MTKTIPSLGALRRFHNSGAKDRAARKRGLNKALRNVLLRDRSNQTVASFPIWQHWCPPPIPADDIPGQNPLSAKRMVVRLELGLCNRPEKDATCKK
jgi:hypothetical protein